jgi:galactose-1-phosphate uridylyltransferase
MTEEQYQQILLKTPNSETPEFIHYLQKKNKIIKETDLWLVVANIKHSTKVCNWFTAFPKRFFKDFRDQTTEELVDFKTIIKELELDDFFKYENSYVNKTVERFHVHIVEDWQYYMYRMLLNMPKKKCVKCNELKYVCFFGKLNSSNPRSSCKECK